MCVSYYVTPLLCGKAHYRQECFVYYSISLASSNTYHKQMYTYKILLKNTYATIFFWDGVLLCHLGYVAKLSSTSGLKWFSYLNLLNAGTTGMCLHVCNTIFYDFFSVIDPHYYFIHSVSTNRASTMRQELYLVLGMKNWSRQTKIPAHRMLFCWWLRYFWYMSHVTS